MPWDPRRTWHPRHTSSTGDAPADRAQDAEAAAPLPSALYLVGGWRAAVIDPRTWELGARSSNEYIVKEGTARQLLLRRIQDRDDNNPHGALRPTVWADAPDDPRSGLRVLEPRSSQEGSAAAVGASPSSGATRIRGAPDPSTDAPWMHPAPSRPPPKRVRLASGEAAAPVPPPPPPEPPPSDSQDLAARQPAPEVPWSRAWRVAGDRDLDRSQRILAWRILHGRLRVGAFLFFFFFFFCKDKVHTVQGHPGGRMRPNLTTYSPDRRNPENCFGHLDILPHGGG